MTRLSVFEKHSGLRSSIKSSLYYVEFPLEMKKYVEPALAHLCRICEEDAQDVQKEIDPEINTGPMTYNEFSKRYYGMFKDYEETLIAINGPDFDMMKTIYQNWRENFPNFNPLTYCSFLQTDLEKKCRI